MAHQILYVLCEENITEFYPARPAAVAFAYGIVKLFI